MRPTSGIVCFLGLALSISGTPSSAVAADEAVPPIDFFWIGEPMREDFVPPVLIRFQAPRMPDRGVAGMARSGALRVCFMIKDDGKVTEVRIPDNVPGGYFEKVIRRAVIRWRFRPATLAGVPQAQGACTVFKFRSIGG